MSATIRLSPGIPSTMSLKVFGSIGSPPEPPLPINCFTMGSSAAGAGAGAGAAGAGAAGAGAGAGGFGLGFWFGFGSGLGSGSGGSGCSSREAQHPMEAQHLMDAQHPMEAKHPMEAQHPLEAQHPINRSEFDAVHMFMFVPKNLKTSQPRRTRSSLGSPLRRIAEQCLGSAAISKPHIHSHQGPRRN